MNKQTIKLKKLLEITKIAKRAAKNAQEENHRLGLPNIYELNKHIVFMYPDGRVESKPRPEYSK